MLRFYADISSGWLNVFYKCEGDADWTYQNTYITADSIYFIAPLSGVYQLKFTGSSVSVDDFIGFLKPMQGATLNDNPAFDVQNAEVIAYFKDQKVNVYYDRVLSAVNNGYGQWTPKAYTLCLPYEFRFGELVEPGKVKFYQLSFIDDYYKQFVFTAVADVAEAGKAYLAVVEQGDVSLNAYNVTLTAEPVTDKGSTAIDDYGEWFFNGDNVHMGQWVGSFKSITAQEADGKNMFCLLEDGSWARFTSDDNPDAKLNAFRGYYQAYGFTEEAGRLENRAQANQNPMTYRTLFSNAGVANVNDGSVPDALNILYEADIPTPTATPTGIQPTIKTIEADGTSRYFDLNGRMLDGKPDKGLYIHNGKKVIQ